MYDAPSLAVLRPPQAYIRLPVIKPLWAFPTLRCATLCDNRSLSHFRPVTGDQPTFGRYNV